MRIYGSPGRRLLRLGCLGCLVAVVAVTGACAGPTGDTGPPPSSPGPTSALDEASGPLVVAEGLEVPWGVTFFPPGSGFPDGSALVSQRRSGEVVLVDPTGAVSPVGVVAGVVSSAEGGLLGLVVSPAFAQDRHGFAYVAGAEGNRIVRFTVIPNPDGGATMGAAEPILEGIATAPVHDGGRLAFGPDGMLYASTGDAGVGERAQDISSPNGKILRMTPDGDPAPGNPFADQPYPASLVYSLGHRNVEGLAWDDDGRLYATEFGSSAFDEVNLVKPGSNYGWPEVEGHDPDDRFAQPLVTWRPSESSPAGIAHAAGALWVGALRGEGLWRIPLSEGEVGPPEQLLHDIYGRIRTVVTTPEGSIWFTTSNRDGRGSPSPTDDRILQMTVSNLPPG